MFNNLSSWIGPHLDTETVIAQKENLIFSRKSK